MDIASVESAFPRYQRHFATALGDLGRTVDVHAG